MASPTVDYVIRATDQTAQAFRSVDSRIAGIGKGLKTLTQFAGFAALTGGLTRLATEAVELAGDLTDVGAKLDINVESLQVLKIAAEEAGGSFGGVQSALQFLVRTNQQAITGNKKAAEAFRALGVDASKFAELPLDERLAIIADQLARIENPSQRLALQFQLLGKQSADLAPLLAQGSGALQDIEADLRELGTILSEDQVRALDEWGDAWERVQKTAVAAAGKLVAGVAEKLEGVPTLLRTLLSGGSITDFQGIGGGGGGTRTPTPAGGAAAAAAPGVVTGGPTALRGTSGDGKAKAVKVEQDYLAALQGTALQINLQTELEKTFTAERARGAALTESLRTPFEKYGDTLREINELLSQQAITQETANRAIAQAGQDYAKAQTDIAGANDVLKDSTTELLEELKVAANGFARDLTDVFFDSTQSIGDMFENLAKTIAKALFTQAVTEPLIGAITGGLGSIFGLPGGGILNAAGRSIGGSVAAGTPYLVGERGPELFVPRRGGTIVPNGGGSQTVNVTFQVNSLDPGTAAGVIQANRQQIVGMIRGAVQRTGRRPAMA